MDIRSKIKLLNYCECEFGEYGEYAINTDDGMDSLMESMEWNSEEIKDLLYNNDELDKPILFSCCGGRGLESISIKDMNNNLLEMIKQNINNKNLIFEISDNCVYCDNQYDCDNNWNEENIIECINKFVEKLKDGDETMMSNIELKIREFFNVNIIFSSLIGNKLLVELSDDKIDEVKMNKFETYLSENNIEYEIAYGFHDNEFEFKLIKG